MFIVADLISLSIVWLLFVCCHADFTKSDIKSLPLHTMCDLNNPPYWQLESRFCKQCENRSD